MQDTKMTFVGAGNMAFSLIGGLIADGYPPDKIWVCDPHGEKLEFLAEKFGVHTSTNDEESVASADIVLFAVKPQSMQKAVSDLANAIAQRNPLIISVAAGIRLDQIQEWLGAERATVRCMPNTPAMLRCGATALYANALASEEQKELAEAILRAVGVTVWLSEESHIDVVTALSGSGPAYFFLIMEALAQGAQTLGLPSEIAHLLTLQTALGAARMALESSESVEELRHRVTSPGGTTEYALNVLEQGGVRNLLLNALRVAEQRAKELAS